jgi:hypothetical protein
MIEYEEDFDYQCAVEGYDEKNDAIIECSRHDQHTGPHHFYDYDENGNRTGREVTWSL